MVYLHPSSVLTISYPEWVIYVELLEHCKIIYAIFLENKLTMHNVMEIDPHWLFEIAPHFYLDARKELAEKKHIME